jgi:hypothetical protein
VQSIPHIPFVVLSIVLLQESAVFVLEALRPMMLLLCGDVAPELGDTILHGRKHAVSSLPVEIIKRSILALDPFRRLLLEALEKIRGRDRPSETTEDVDVIFDSSDDQGGRLQIPTSSTKIRVQLIPKGAITQEGDAVLRGEHDMGTGVSKGLRHGDTTLSGLGMWLHLFPGWRFAYPGVRQAKPGEGEKTM